MIKTPIKRIRFITFVDEQSASQAWSFERRINVAEWILKAMHM